MSEARLTTIETKLDAVFSQQQEHGVRLERLETRVEQLKHQMLVLHEDTIANIRALAPDFAPIRRPAHRRALPSVVRLRATL